MTVSGNDALADAHGLCSATIAGSLALVIGTKTFANLNFCQYTTAFDDSTFLPAASAWCADPVARLRKVALAGWAPNLLYKLERVSPAVS